jgi:hypothetical protein
MSKVNILQVRQLFVHRGRSYRVVKNRPLLWLYITSIQQAGEGDIVV